MTSGFHDSSYALRDNLLLAYSLSLLSVLSSWQVFLKRCDGMTGTMIGSSSQAP